jgi:hypothetical protein
MFRQLVVSGDVRDRPQKDAICINFRESKKAFESQVLLTVLLASRVKSGAEVEAQTFLML